MGFIVTKASHTDHTLPKGLLDWAQQQTQEREGFFIATLDIPASFGIARCALRGPMVGDGPVTEEDAVIYKVRNGRQWATRVTTRLGLKETRHVTLIAGPSGDDPCVLYTIYAGPMAPRETGDFSLKTMEEINESRAFWSQHALSANGA